MRIEILRRPIPWGVWPHAEQSGNVSSPRLAILRIGARMHGGDLCSPTQ
jgi:hypothetical protein